MNVPDPINLMFGGMDKLGPGANEQTLQALQLLPQRQFDVVVDAGCGTGRQTLALAQELGTLVHAVDSSKPFLDDLVQLATEAKIEELLEVHCMDMTDIPHAFRNVDLLWSECSAYNIGFSQALTTWAVALRPDAFAVVSELSWLKARVPDVVTEFFRTGYPDMASVPENVAIAENAGYTVLTTQALPRNAWTDGYYEILMPRAQALLDHPDNKVRALAAQIVREIDVFDVSDDSYGYVFYLLRRA